MSRATACLLLLLAAVPAAADPIDEALEACSEAPEGEDCAFARLAATSAVTHALLTAANSGQRDRFIALVHDYADAPYADVRFAAAAALGGLRPRAEDTALLARLLNDPMPVVRQAARASLAASQDPAAKLLVERAREEQGESFVPDPEFDAAMALPPGARFVRFADGPVTGLTAFVTDQPAVEVAAFFGRTRPPLDVAAFVTTYPSQQAQGAALADQARQLSEMMAQLGNPLAPGFDPQALRRQMEEMQRLALGATQGVAAASAAEWQRVERYIDSDVYRDVRLVVLEEAASGPPAPPVRFVAVFEDASLGATGFVIHAAPVEPEPAPPVVDPLEEDLWATVGGLGAPALLQVYLDVYPEGRYAAAARAKLAALPPP